MSAWSVVLTFVLPAVAGVVIYQLAYRQGRAHGYVRGHRAGRLAECGRRSHGPGVIEGSTYDDVAPQFFGAVPLETISWISGISGVSERFLRDVLAADGLKVCTCGAALTGADHEPGCPSWHDDDDNNGMRTEKEWRP